MSRVVLIVGAGRCGLVSLLNVFSKQPRTRATLEETPLLPWDRWLRRHEQGASV